MKKILKIIDWISTLQKGMALVLLALVGVTVIDVVMRYIFKSPIQWGKDMETYLYGALFLMCAAYTHKIDGHVRIPIVVERFFSPRAQEVIAILMYVVFFLPFAVVMMVYGWKFFLKSWAVKETAFTPWHPPLYPIKFIIPLSAFMLLLQGCAEMARHFIRLIKGGGAHES
ncbi:MAG: TRAP transporter small permease subunit [Deltaproteobacteria bacterium]|nr:TRAP transporter small permease subunit [Deltaproteobacteria bacterium]